MTVERAQPDPTRFSSIEAARGHAGLKPGDTGFASTDTHYVDAAGILLVAASWRWAHGLGPGDSGDVSRVDECPSTTGVGLVDQRKHER
jgi:hypothetical protein